jgi:cobalt-zinc-cadmium efflux system protein
MSDHDHHGHDAPNSGVGGSGGAPGRAGGAPARLRALWIALVLNAAFMLVEGVAGLLSGSLALLGDAGHMLADVGALALALAAEKLAQLDGGPSHTWGWRRAPTLGAFGNALSMYVVGGVLCVEAIRRFSDPPEIASLPVLVVGIVGLGVNVLSAVYLHREGGHSHNVKGALLHMVGDALGSVAVIVSAVVIELTGWRLIDPLMTIAIALLIMAATWPLMRDVARTLLQISPRTVDVQQLRAAILAHDAVTCLEDFHVWELDAGYLVVTAAVHAHAPDLAAVERVSAEIKADLAARFGAQHVTLEIVREREHPALAERCC